MKKYIFKKNLKKLLWSGCVATGTEEKIKYNPVWVLVIMSLQADQRPKQSVYSPPPPCDLSFLDRSQEVGLIKEYLNITAFWLLPS